MRFLDELQWRDLLVDDWNRHWYRVENDWFQLSRASKFDYMMWQTIRSPALIPQVWLNWYHAGPERLLRELEEGQASRVDFVAFANGERHVIEIDGPSHYATWEGHGYEPDEKEYARNLRIARWLEDEGWKMTRVGRWEVREAMDEDELFGAWTLMRVLPFGTSYPPRLRPEALGVPEIEQPPDDEIPF